MNANMVISSQKLNSEENKKLKEISGVNVYSCYQCGNCSASCPAVEFMDIAPHSVIRLVQLGYIDEVLKTNTAWICAACINCTVKCPRGVDIARVMEGLRQIVLRKKTDHVNIIEIDKSLREKLPQLALISNFRKFVL
ncbi:hypothetical protein ES703_13688 [subsurface metagenome]